MKKLNEGEFDTLSYLDQLKHIQKAVSELEIKILYNSELANDDIMKEIDVDLKELNLLYLDVMTKNDELEAKCDAFEKMLDSKSEVA